MIKTDILIIGAGPCGLFTVFEAGLLNLKCHLVDALPQSNGLDAKVYPEEPIYDIPGFRSILAGDLIDNLVERIVPFKPSFTLGERTESVERLEDQSFKLVTDKGTEINASVIVVADGLDRFESQGIIKHREKGVFLQAANHVIPLLGFPHKLKPNVTGKVTSDKNTIDIDAFDYSTNIPGVYAIGDINTYPRKLKLILCGFHEATLMIQSALRYINSEKKLNRNFATANNAKTFSMN